MLESGPFVLYRRQPDCYNGSAFFGRTGLQQAEVWINILKEMKVEMPRFGFLGFSRSEWLLFLLLFMSYAYFFQGGGWNQNARYDLVRAIAEEGRLSIDSFVANTGDYALFNGHYHPNKPPGVAWLALPIYGALYWSERAFGLNPATLPLLRWNIYLMTLGSLGLISALAGVFYFRWLGLLSPSSSPLSRLALVISCFLGTMMLPYSTLFSDHQIIAALLIFSLYRLYRLKIEPNQDPRPTLLLAGFFLGYACVCQYIVAGIVPFFGLYLLTFPIRRSLVMVYFGLGLFIPFVMICAYNIACFDTPFTTNYAHEASVFKDSAAWLGVFEPLRLFYVWGLLFSAYRGLFYTSPILLLALPGFFCWRGQGQRAELGLCLAISLFFFLFNVSFNGRTGGWTFGPRYLVPLIPMLGLAVWQVFRRYRLVSGLLAGLSIGIMLLVTSVNPSVPGRPRNPLFDYIVPRFLAGDISANTQGIDEFRPEAKYPHHSTIARTNSFNLGEIIGLPGQMSLLPLLLVWTILGFLLLRSDQLITPQEAPDRNLAISDHECP
jgi:hypothetical protein